MKIPKVPEHIILSQDEILMGFAASCIEWAAETLGCDYLDVFERMDKVGMIDNYIIPYYDTLHFESRKHITDDLLETLNLWEQRQNKTETYERDN